MLRNISFLIIGILLSAPIVYAQSIAPDPVQYTIIPEQPGPNEQVTIQAEGVGQFLGNSTITWQQNGKTVEGAANSPTFRFTTGGVGTATRIHIRIDSATQGTITRDFVFNPSVVNMIWEADTYTPLLYKGKALYTAGSPLKVVAYPTVFVGGALVPASKLSFQWRHNDTPDPASSGLGKNIFSFTGDQLQREETVSVSIYSGNAIVARGDVTIPASSPKVIFYPQDPLRGELLGSAFGTQASLPQTETTFKAEPYFFSARSVRNGELQYNWTLNDQDTTGPDAAKGMLTLRQTGSGVGSADLGVSVQNTGTSQLIQAASAALHLVFGQSNSAFSSFFGL